MAVNSIDGFSFADPQDAHIAELEIKKIKLITDKMKMDNPKGVLAVYDKLIQSGIFVTPIGMEFMRSLQDYLYKSPAIEDEAVKEIPVTFSYTDAINGKKEAQNSRVEFEREKRAYRKTFKNEYKISLILNLILFVMVIAMFVITLKAENPNMLNYRTAIINQYSQWEQELDEREQKIKEKELELFTE